MIKGSPGTLPAVAQPDPSAFSPGHLRRAKSAAWETARESEATIDFIPSDVATMGFQRHPSRTSSAKREKPVSMPHIAGGVRRPTSNTSFFGRGSSAGQNRSNMMLAAQAGEADDGRRAISARPSLGRSSVTPRGSIATTSRSNAAISDTSPQRRRITSATGRSSAHWEQLLVAAGKSAKVQMEKMLTMKGFDNPGTSQIATEGVDDLAILLEEENAIYQGAFASVISQVAPEQGELLMLVRAHYRHMFSRVPRQVKTLRRELLESQALNREFAEEITRLDDRISEICDQIEQLLKADTNAPKAQRLTDRFASSVTESESGTKMLRQLQSLYDMQRQRTEHEMQELQKSNDQWITISQKLSTKICNPRSRATMDSIDLCSNGWCQGGLKLVGAIAARDETLVTRVERTLSIWRTHLTSVVRWISKVDGGGLPLMQQIQNQVSEQRGLLEGGGVDRLELLRATEKMAEKLYDLVEQRLRFLEEIDPGTVERLAELVSSWCDDTYTLMECHPSLDKGILSDMFVVNELSAAAAEQVAPLMLRAREVIKALRRQKEALRYWQREQDDPSSKLINDANWQSFLLRWVELEEVGAKIIFEAPQLDTKTPSLHVDIKRWGSCSMNWAVRLQTDVSIVTGTLEAQVRKARIWFKEWSVLVDLCLAGFLEGHPDIVDGKYIRLWGLAENMTAKIEDSASANMQVVVPVDTSRSEDGPTIDALYDLVIDKKDLATLRDDVTEFNEQAVTLMRQLRENFRAPVDTAALAAGAQFKKSKDAMLVPSEDGELFQITIPGIEEIKAMIANLKTPAAALGGRNRKDDIAVKMVVNAEERLAGLRKLVQGQLKQYMPEVAYNALPLWQKLAKDPQ